MAKEPTYTTVKLTDKMYYEITRALDVYLVAVRDDVYTAPSIKALSMASITRTLNSVDDQFMGRSSKPTPN